MTSVITVERPVSDDDFEDVRALMRGFVAWHRERHTEDLHLIDAYFDEHAFEHELETLPQYYAPRELGESIVATAKRSGYRAMRLDTSFRQIEALQLYRALGFHEIEPYYELSQELRDWLVFMELDL